jgi:hypothetical protein
VLGCARVKQQLASDPGTFLSQKFLSPAYFSSSLDIIITFAAENFYG